MASKAASSAAKAATSAASKAAPKSADSSLYHMKPQSPFWEKFRKAMVVNPDSSSGNWITTKFRNPEPGSRPEKYARPPSKASDPAQNSYYERDFRRRYPRLDVVTQAELSSLLLAQPEALRLPAPTNAPAQKAAEGVTDVTTVPSPAPSLSSLYYAPKDSSSTPAFYTASQLPPTPVSAIKLSWAPAAEKIERDPYAYFPMDTYSSTIIRQDAGFGHDTQRGYSDEVGKVNA